MRYLGIPFWEKLCVVFKAQGVFSGGFGYLARVQSSEVYMVAIIMPLRGGQGARNLHGCRKMRFGLYLGCWVKLALMESSRILAKETVSKIYGHLLRPLGVSTGRDMAAIRSVLIVMTMFWGCER